MFNLIGFVIAGLIIGVIARLLVPGRQRIGILGTLLIGVVGSLIGGFVATYLGTGQYFELNVIGFVGAVLASTVVLAVAEAAGVGGSRDRKRLGR